MVLAGMNFALLYRLFVRRKAARGARDEEARLYLAILAVMSLLLAVELWQRGLRGRGGGLPAGDVPGRLDDDDDGVREHGLRRLADVRA